MHATPSTAPDSATANEPSQCHSEGLTKITKPAKVKSGKMAEKKKRRTKKWKRPKDKPTRPLSAYNFFFQSERALMLGTDAPSDEEEAIKKRVHCKTHGKIGFAEMARMIGGKWKALEHEKKKVFEQQAKKEKDCYATKLAIWKEGQQDKSDDESSKGGSSQGLDAITPTNASPTMVCDQSEYTKFLLHGPAIDAPRSSDEFRFMVLADELQRRKIRLLQQSPPESPMLLEYLWALREQRQRDTTLLGGPYLDYTTAAEASANAILQQFQNGQTYSPKQRSLHAASRLSGYNPMMASAMHRVQNRFMANEYGFTGYDFNLLCR